ITLLVLVAQRFRDTVQRLQNCLESHLKILLSLADFKSAFGGFYFSRMKLKTSQACARERSWILLAHLFQSQRFKIAPKVQTRELFCTQATITKQFCARRTKNIIFEFSWHGLEPLVVGHSRLHRPAHCRARCSFENVDA